VRTARLDPKEGIRTPSDEGLRGARQADDTTAPSDEVLLVRYAHGDRTAFAVLVRRHQTGLYNFALRNLRDRTAAEDIVQEAFARVAQSALEFKADARFTTWVYTIVRNLCIDQIRRASLRRHPSLDEPRPFRSEGSTDRAPTLGDQTPDRRGAADIERSADGAKLRERIQRAIDALPEEQREVYLMRELSNLRFKDIAEITKIPENTVKSRMRYALERLQEALVDFEEHARALR
jgi:RNA polymerase sigma-70 factor (ECF subfamily)